MTHIYIKPSSNRRSPTSREAAFRAVLLVFNLLAEFQRAAACPAIENPPRSARRC